MWCTNGVNVTRQEAFARCIGLGVHILGVGREGDL